MRLSKLKDFLFGKSELGMRGAAVIQFAAKYTNICVQLVLTAVLARLISPAQFGVASIVTVITAFFVTFSDAGIGAAIIQFDDLTERDFGALFCFSSVLGACLAGTFFLASGPVAAFYGDPTLASLCRVASLTLFFATLNMVPNGVMLREKRFRQVGARLICSTVFSGVCAVALALAGAGPLAVVLQATIMAASDLALNLHARPLREVNPHFSRPLGRVFSYSAFQFGFNAINYFNRSLANLVIGRALGTTPLGNYDKAYKLTTYPMTAFSSVVGSVIQPFMARHQDDPDAIFDCFMRVEKVVSLVAAPVATVFFCAPAEVVGLMYGPQWAAAVEPFRFLGVSVYFQMLGNPTGPFFQSLGRTDMLFRQGLVNTCLTVGGLVVGIAMGGLDSVAFWVAAGFCLQIVPIARLLVGRAFGKPMRSLFAFVPELGVAVAAALACRLVAFAIPLSGLVSLFVKCGVIVLVFAAGYAALGQYRHLKALIRK